MLQPFECGSTSVGRTYSGDYRVGWISHHPEDQGTPQIINPTYFFKERAPNQDSKRRRNYTSSRLVPAFVTGACEGVECVSINLSRSATLHYLCASQRVSQLSMLSNTFGILNDQN